MSLNTEDKGIGLIKPLVIIASFIIIIAASLFFFDPVRKFKSARDAERWSDVSLILNSLQDYQRTQKDSSLMKEIEGLYRGDWYLIVGGSKMAGCDDINDFSDVKIFDDYYCLDLFDLVDEGYLGEIPVSPKGNVKWDKGLQNVDKGTGYAFMIDKDDVLHIQACESENTSEILISRKLILK